MIYSSFDISKKFLSFAEKDGWSINPLKLIKLVYIAHGWHLGIKERPLIKDQIEAWEYGIIVPNLYYVTRRFVTNPVDVDLIELYSEKEVDSETEKFLKSVWETYGKMSALELSSRTYADKEVLSGSGRSVLDNSDIMAHYKVLVEEAENRIKNSGL